MSGPSAPVQAVLPVKPAAPAAHGVLQRCGPVPCDCAHDEERGVLHRTAVQPVGAPAPPVPPSVREVLGSPGAPLASGARAFHEPRFGHDFSAVRVHADARAAASAAAVGARAYTVGNHIVLGRGALPPSTLAGRRLLAHELVHVVQQHGGASRDESLSVGAADSPAEHEADDVAARVARGAPVGVRRRGPASVLRRQLSCPELIAPTDTQAVRGIGTPAHDAIEQHVRSTVGSSFWKQPIPGASSTPGRTEDRDERRRRSRTGTERVSPQVIGGRAGPGTPDLGLRDGRTLEVAEVKPAILSYGPVGGLIEGEAQLLRYVLAGNSRENRPWRADQRPRVDLVSPMQPSRVTWPRSLTTADGRRIAAGWCLPGLVGYRPLSAEEAETIVCGVSDRAGIDRFLNLALGSAQATVDRFIDESVDPLLTRRIQTLSIREGVTLLARYARGALRNFVASQLPVSPDVLLDVVPGGDVLRMLGDDEVVDAAATWIEEQVKDVAALRAIVLQVKTELLTRVRQQLKQRLRTYLQETLTAVCAAAAVGSVVSVAQLLKRLAQDMVRMFGEAVVTVAVEWATAVAAALAKAILTGILVAIAIAVLLFFLPEIVVALAAAGEFLVAAGGAAAALGPRLAPMIENLVDVVLRTAPALQGATP